MSEPLDPERRQEKALENLSAVLNDVIISRLPPYAMSQHAHTVPCRKEWSFLATTATQPSSPNPITPEPPARCSAAGREAETALRPQASARLQGLGFGVSWGFRTKGLEGFV